MMFILACTELYAGKRAKFLTTILWLATTYVLADVYSAQLTSQLARPAREPPISNSVIECRPNNLNCIFCHCSQTLSRNWRRP